MNRLVSLLVIISLTSFTSIYPKGNGQGTKVHTLVIDPGHGGMDPGAIGPGGHHESELALAISLKFGAMVHQAFPDMRIIYTRTTDKFVSLADRADTANKEKADIFICIHLNSVTTRDAYGTSSYVLGMHRTDAQLEVAKRENAVIELEGDRDKKYEFDPNSPEGNIIMITTMNAFLDQSILIASKIEQELAVMSRTSRGVKQAGFWVLYKTAMPSVLAEVGFISNPTEEAYLASAEGQTNIATSLFKAFRAYKYEIEGIKDTAAAANPPKSIPSPPVVKNTGTAKTPDNHHTALPKDTKPDTLQATAHVSVQPDTLPTAHRDVTPKHDSITAAKKPAPTKPATKPLAGAHPDTKQKTDSSTAAKKPDTAKPATKPAASTSQSDTQTIVRNGKVEINREDVPPKVDTPKPVLDTILLAAYLAHRDSSSPAVIKAVKDTIKTKPAAVKTKPATAHTAPQKDTVKTAAMVKIKDGSATIPKDTLKKPKAIAAENSEGFYFAVQLVAAKNRPANYNDLVKTFGIINTEEITAGVVRYMAGEYKSYAQAQKGMKLAIAKGYKDAFIVAYVNKERQYSKETYQLSVKHP